VLTLSRTSARLDALALRLKSASTRPLEARTRRLELAERSLTAVSPLAVLARGYSITSRAAGGPPLVDVQDLPAGETLVTRLARGSITSKVERTDAGDTE
jgi:exodeoxyribonuclease VII large subunit